jgi:HlyD family secretion protein
MKLQKLFVLRSEPKARVTKGAAQNRIVAAAMAALLLFSCAKKEDATLTGYVEADLIYLAPQDAGVVRTLNVREGDRVKAGDVLFTLDPARMSMAAEQASASAQGVAARAAVDGVLDRRIAEAKAAHVFAEQTFRRARELIKDDAISKEKYDADAAALASAKARLDAAQAERGAMAREVDAAGAAARLAERRLADLEVAAPADGAIERIYRRPGEIAAAGDPVVALLAPENLKIKFFAPERLLSSVQAGARISFSCSGCDGARAATISFVASEPQFTPPVIYSIKERDKLVFLVEARPDEPAGLRPGLPVTVDIP